MNHSSDPFDPIKTAAWQRADTEDATLQEIPSSPPGRIGRHRLERVLGEGTFGVVYLAFDEQLNRWVAIKVPHRKLVSRSEDAAPYLREARAVAGLDHRNIVPVYDVGQADGFPCFLVSKFIEGVTLAKRLEAGRLSFGHAADLAAAVAEALHHAHGKGLVHRDIKPGNILLDRAGCPYVADFGVALSEDELGRGPRFVGTPSYMSPEQARGEGHRVDGRSDIFSLGVVLYELLTGRLPFRAETRDKLLEQVRTSEARPPRQIDDSIPRELERICLKAMANRASERYTTAKDMAEDLRRLGGSAGAEDMDTGNAEGGDLFLSDSVISAGPTVVAASGPGSSARGGLTRSDSEALRVVPKGLRSFDARDADSFLELLPGPRDRDGLPETLRFWKDRIEETDPDNTFPVGLLYGPSGCGKSSLVKAGLLPRLSGAVRTAYIEATPGETETRVLNALRKRCPDLPRDQTLREVIAALRRGQGLEAGEKILIVLDQFEQWLHANRGQEGSALVEALRQCDGGRVQTVVMVRDDFWMAATRFMRELEIRLVEGQNSGAVDLFPVRHAERVLAAFGRAFGCLPGGPTAATKEQAHFLTQAVAGLAQEGKVVCVRLALFAEMMKGRTWTPATLREVGGTEGVGVTFLDGTLSAATAPPEHRYHKSAARAVLRALLPESGSDIKGCMRSSGELLEASGYNGRPQDFDALLRILDSEVRLITPTDPPGAEPDRNPKSGPGAEQAYYQLTHDYLVPSLRAWLTRKQKESRQGRAELLLEDRASIWSARLEKSQLPSAPEWLTIRLLTRKLHWTDVQRKMMSRATRYHATRAGGLGLALLLLAVSGLRVRAYVVDQRKQAQATGLVRRLVDASIVQVPTVIAELEPFREWVDPLLRAENEQGADASNQKLHLSLALLPVDHSQAKYLCDQLLANPDPQVVIVIREALIPQGALLVDRLWKAAERTGPDPVGARLRAACALARYDPMGEGWDRCGARIANDLVAVNPLHLGPWSEAFRPVKDRLREALAGVFRDTRRPETERALATNVLADYAAADPGFLATLVTAADEKQFSTLFPRLRAHGVRGLPRLLEEVARPFHPSWGDSAVSPMWKEPGDSLRQRVESAGGLLAERFALVQTMPLPDFLDVVERLRLCGYRPTRFRPYVKGRASSRAGGEVLIAAVWTRDGRPWRLEHGLSVEEARQRETQNQAQSFGPVDAATYRKGECLKYGGVWVRQERPDDVPRASFGLADDELAREDDALRQRGYQRASWSASEAPTGETRACVVWSKPAAGEAGGCQWFSGVEPDYSGENHLGDVEVDVSMHEVHLGSCTRLQFTRQLADAAAVLHQRPADVDARLKRGVACYHLGQDALALEDLSWTIEHAPARAEASLYRALIRARSAHRQEARADATVYLKSASDPSLRAGGAAILSASLGEDGEGMRHLEEALAKHARQPQLLYQAARAYAVAVGLVGRKDMVRSRLYADRAAALIKDAVANGYTAYAGLITDPDFDPLWGHRGFENVVRELHLDRHYLAVWHPGSQLVSAEVHGLSPAEHLMRCRELTAEGFRPAGIAVAAPADSGGHMSASSIWHRPVVPASARLEAARRRANAAAALVALGQPDSAWPLLRHGPDPSVRSQLIHRLGPSGVETRDLIARLGDEPDVSIQRALVLSLGEFDEQALRAVGSQELVTALRSIFRESPDAGLHAAAEWTLRRVKDDAWLDETISAWARDSKQRTPKRGSAGATTTESGTRPGWLVNGQGQTLTVISGPVEFLMGAPATEPGRLLLDRQHRVRIGRSFAIATKPVTVAEFKRFKPEYDYLAQYAPTPDCPVHGISWFMAAAYCNWLSREEGLPQSEWCYEGNKEGKLEEQLRLAPSYLKRTGYRMPTEAEWEYACRAGAVTSRYYGDADSLLGQYGWYSGNSDNRSWPVGRLKPNDLGLFDMHGNVWVWCQDRLIDYVFDQGGRPIDDVEDFIQVVENDARVLRGGAFGYQAANLRSASRKGHGAGIRSIDVGFRPARTIRMATEP